MAPESAEAPSKNWTVPSVTGFPALVTVAVNVTPLPVNEGFREELTVVAVGAAATAVVTIRDHPPAMLMPVMPPLPACGPRESSITYKLHVPFGLMPLNWPPRVALPNGVGYTKSACAGAGAGKLSLFDARPVLCPVGLKVPVTNTPTD